MPDNAVPLPCGGARDGSAAMIEHRLDACAVHLLFAIMLLRIRHDGVWGMMRHSSLWSGM